MGLLDDAIREHLELKRQRGGDPAEIARQETDALSPARRTPEPSELEAVPAADDLRAPMDPEPATEYLERPPADLDPAGERLADDLPDEEYEVDLPDESPPAATPAYDPPPITHDPQPPAVDPPRPVYDPPPTPSPASDVSQHTEQFSVADLEAAQAPTPPEARPREDPSDGPDIPSPDGEPPHDDALEETPEFLEETPEHDRLWFEQRPPRDFDFGS